ncbi:carbohydrate ABC transporter membrane protein 1, CUT1 family [Glycomyces sambucus]|uniref:Carbohydrate ABC transporter membrane protein 1, CUT1 family n=1 Tax=Glycomyces sambucus TaxID=380244 RepID=A0A1G9LAM9_9ACTN|nr:sugar ABC transporter permease [Glycomyces sambucus]SDL58605.1 carbohydrate ABC transporter membrane protein 1, CUT1 family [Glycomyces sambucus]
MSTDTATPAAASTADRPPSPAPARAPKRRSWLGLWFVLPFLAVYAVFMLWPMLLGLYYSFTDKSLTGRPVEWIGLANWAEAFGDPAAMDSLWNTARFTVLSTPPLVILGLAFALLAHRARRIGWFLRLSFFAPFVIPVSVVTMIWLWMYQPAGGLINHYLGEWGLGGDRLWAFQEDAMGSVVATTVWWTLGFNFLLYLAALQTIPAEVYEAADIDGANSLQKLWGITLPLLKRTTALVIVLQLIASLRIFDQYYLMAGGAANLATENVFIQYIYNSGFVGFRIGYASALSYILFVCIIVIALIQFRLLSRRED